MTTDKHCAKCEKKSITEYILEGCTCKGSDNVDNHSQQKIGEGNSPTEENRLSSKVGTADTPWGSDNEDSTTCPICKSKDNEHLDWCVQGVKKVEEK